MFLDRVGAEVDRRGDLPVGGAGCELSQYFALALVQFGTVVGYYGDLYVVQTRRGGLKTREHASAIVRTLDEFPTPRRTR